MINVSNNQEGQIKIKISGDLTDVQRELAAVISAVYNGAVEMFKENKEIHRPTLIAKDYISSAVNVAFESETLNSVNINDVKIDNNKN